RECVEQVLDLFSAHCAEKGIALGLCYESDLPTTIIADSSRLRQVLVNLVGNAVKFTERGGIALALAAPPGPDSWELEFTVEDSGIGIPAERMDRLFKSFSQVDTSTTRRYGGTGLGLAISARLVELMHGRITATSQDGKGSRFTFTIKAGVA